MNDLWRRDRVWTGDEGRVKISAWKFWQVGHGKICAIRSYFLVLHRVRVLLPCENFGEMEGAAGGVLSDLLPAAKAVGQQDGLGLCPPDGREEDALGQSLRNLIFFALEAEWASHSAAAGVEQGDFGSGAAEQVDLGVHFEGRFVVTVAVEKDALSGEAGRAVIRRVPREEIAEQEALIAEATRARVIGEEVTKLVVEDAGAGGFEKNDGKARVDLRGQGFEDALEITARGGEEAEVIEWASAAEMLPWKPDVEPRGFEDLLSGR